MGRIDRKILKEGRLLSGPVRFLTSKSGRKLGIYAQVNRPPPFADNLPRKPRLYNLCLPHDPIDSFLIVPLAPIGLEDVTVP